MALVILAAVLVLFAPASMQAHFIVFALAVVVGFYVITGVSHSLHTPLMSVTNAISGIIIVGAMLLIGSGSPLVIALAFIAMVIASLKAAGLEEFQVELGQVEFYRGLVEEAGLNEDTKERLRELIENKNFFGVEELLTEQTMTEEQRQLFTELISLDMKTHRLSPAWVEWLMGFPPGWTDICSGEKNQ